MKNINLWIRKSFLYSVAAACLLLIIIFGGCIPNSTPRENEQKFTLIPRKETVTPLDGTSPTPTLLLSDGQKKIRLRGEVILKTVTFKGGSNSLDLDSGRLIENESGDGDVSLRSDGGSSIFEILMPLNGAKYFFAEKTDTSFSECYQNLTNYSSFNIPDFANGNAICFLTNERRLSTIRYIPDSFRKGENGEVSIRIEFIVWDQIIN